MSKQWIDISVPIKTGMVHWPDNPAIEVGTMLDMAHGDVCNVSTLSMGAHTGTHMDGPLHFIKDGRSLDTMPVEATIGPAKVIEVKDRECIRPEHVRSQRLKRGDRVLFKTRNSQTCWKTDQFNEDFIYISKEAAQELVDRGIRTVGVDYLSVGGYKKDGLETHLILLGAGIWIIEGLNLSKVKPGRYELVCLPLKVLKSDGAPARAVLRK